MSGILLNPGRCCCAPPLLPCLCAYDQVKHTSIYATYRQGGASTTVGPWPLVSEAGSNFALQWADRSNPLNPVFFVCDATPEDSQLPNKGYLLKWGGFAFQQAFCPFVQATVVSCDPLNLVFTLDPLRYASHGVDRVTIST